MSRLVLAGAGGFGREVFSWAHATAGPDGPWRGVVFIDDNPTYVEGGVRAGLQSVLLDVRDPAAAYREAAVLLGLPPEVVDATG